MRHFTSWDSACLTKRAGSPPEETQETACKYEGLEKWMAQRQASIIRLEVASPAALAGPLASTLDLQLGCTGPNPDHGMQCENIVVEYHALQI